MRRPIPIALVPCCCERERATMPPLAHSGEPKKASNSLDSSHGLLRLPTAFSRASPFAVRWPQAVSAPSVRFSPDQSRHSSSPANRDFAGHPRQGWLGSLRRQGGLPIPPLAPDRQRGRGLGYPLAHPGPSSSWIAGAPSCSIGSCMWSEAIVAPHRPGVEKRS